MRRLRIEPYDPDAVDGDGDGIVQEGTAWERPVGTRLVDASGTEIRRGAILARRPILRVVDSRGAPISYIPSYERRASVPGAATLSQLGYPTLAQRGIVPVRPMGAPTLSERGFRTIQQIYGRAVEDISDPFARIFIRREEILSALNEAQLAEQNRITDFIAGLIARSNASPENKSRMFAILSAASLWASVIYQPSPSASSASSQKLLDELGQLTDADSARLRWLQDVLSLGGEPAYRMAMELAGKRRNQAPEILESEIFIERMSAPDETQIPDGLSESLRELFSELEKFMTPDDDGVIKSQTLLEIDVPDVNETVSGTVTRIGSEPTDLNSTSTGIVFIRGIVDLLQDSPNGRQTMEAILAYFNRNYRRRGEELTIDDVIRIMNDRVNGDDSEWTDKQVNSFFALLLQHEEVKQYVKRRNAESLADTIGNEPGQVELTEEAFEQALTVLFATPRSGFATNNNIPIPSLIDVWGDAIDRDNFEVYPGRNLDDDILLDLFGWAVYGTKPEWVDREDLNPLMAMMFRERPFILRERDNWQSPLMLVPSMMMPSDEPATDSRDKQVFKDLIERLKNTEALENTNKAITALRRVHHFLERAAHQSLARRLNRASSGARNIAFTDNVNGVTYSAQLLELIRSGDLSDEQMEIVTDFIGFDPRQRSEYSLFFANDNVPGTLVPSLPSAARDEMVAKGFLSAGTIFEEFDDSPALVNLVAFSEDGTISGNVNAVIESLKDMYGDDIMLTHSLVAYAEKVDLSNRSIDDVRALGYNEERNGREALVALMEKYIKQWSISANDADPVSLAIQDIAEEEFGIEDAYPFSQFYDDSIFPLDVMEDLVAQVKQRQGAAIRLAIRAQYEATQEFLRRQGIEFLGIVRGFTMPESHPLYPDIIDVSETSVDADLETSGIDGEHSLRPLSSWSTNTPTAIAFSKNTSQLDEDRKSVVVVARVPRQQIFGTALSGNGCLDEYEVVLLGIPTNGRTYPADAARILDRDQTVPEGEGGLDTEWLNLDVPAPGVRSVDYSEPEALDLGAISSSAKETLASSVPVETSGALVPEVSQLFDSLEEVDVYSEDSESLEFGQTFFFEVNPNGEFDPYTSTPEEHEKAKIIASEFEPTLITKGGLEAQPRIQVVRSFNNVLELSGVIFYEGRNVGRFSRSFYRRSGDGKLMAVHESFFLKPEAQSLGIGRAFTSAWDGVYRRYDISSVATYGESKMLSPDLDSEWRGATHWPKQGFDWLSDDERQKFFNYLELIPGTKEMLGLSSEELAMRVPDGVYVAGLSEGEPPTEDDLYIIPYFDSVESWIAFWETYKIARLQKFDDPNRVVPADLLRWAGADKWFMGQGAGIYYKRELD